MITTKSEFTPGPWEAEYEEDDCSGFHKIRMASAIENPFAHKTQHCIAYDHGYFMDDPESEAAFAEVDANARLIAAAPDLYIACRMAFTLLKRVDKLFDEHQLPKSAALAEAITKTETAIAKANGEELK